jgi:RNAse (barnase) inhibitor barstar
MKKIYRIDGKNFSTLEEFYDEISTQVIPGVEWGRNLDAFNDIFRGGFGTPENGFILIWENSRLSRERLGYQETVRQLEKRLARCHPSNTESVIRELKTARRHEGTTVFDWIVEIIQDHGPNGDEPEDDVELELK